MHAGNNPTRRAVVASAASGLAVLAASRRARAQNKPPKPVLRVGCLTDMSGQFRDFGGPVSSLCAKLAGIDFGVSSRPFALEIVQADHQNNIPNGVGIARNWIDNDGVDVILDVNNTGLALQVAQLAREKNKVFLATGTASSDLTGPACNSNMIHWAYDTYMLARSSGSALVRYGNQTWFFLTAEFPAGLSMQRDTTNSLVAANGRLLGVATFPFPTTTDFRPMLEKAAVSGAQVLALACAGRDTIGLIRQAHDMGLTSKFTIAPVLMFVSDIHELGLQTAQGLVFTDSFYWDHNDRTRAFARRLEPLAPMVRPGMGHAGAYSALLHYLKVGTKVGMARMKGDGAAAVAAMKATPADDDCFGVSTIRPDGRCLHPSYLRQVKTPLQSRYPWDYCALISQLPANDAFRPMDLGGCPLIKF